MAAFRTPCVSVRTRRTWNSRWSRSPKDGYASPARSNSAIVGARIGGRWRLGVLRGWKQIKKDGLIMRTEYRDENSANGPACQWFKYRPESVDPLAVNPETGSVVLGPPRLRG